MQQVLRGHGTGVSWGRTPLRGRVSRTAGATAVYALVTLANAVYGGEVPALMQPNGSPAIEAYDAAMGAMIRGAPPPTAVHDPHGQTLPLPDPVAAAHGGLIRMFNQVWTRWAASGVEALSCCADGLAHGRPRPSDSQSCDGGPRRDFRADRMAWLFRTVWQGRVFELSDELAPRPEVQVGG